MPGVTVYRGATLIDGTGAEPIRDSVLAVQGGSVVHAGPEAGYHAAPDETVVDLSGLVVIPGLIDCHAHLRGTSSRGVVNWVLEPNLLQAIVSVAQARSMLDHGFTTIRDISRYGPHLRTAITRGVIPGPRIVACGLGLSRSGGHGDAHDLPRDVVLAGHPSAVLADGPDELRRATRGLIRDGADYIKIWVTGGGHWERDRETDQHYDLEEIATVVREAKAVGLSVAAHAESLAGIKDSLRAGVDTIEHGEELDDECIELMKRSGAILVPTLQLFEKLLKDVAPPYRPGLEDLPGDTLADKEMYRIAENFRMARVAGIPIAVGSDSYPRTLPFGEPALNEVWALVAAGSSPMEALVSATSVGARALGLSETTGSLVRGKTADFIVLQEDPLEDIRHLALENILMVVQGGRTYTDKRRT